jgi:hypothetical protein
MKVGDLVTWRGNDPREDDTGMITDTKETMVYIHWFVEPHTSSWLCKNNNCVKVINESRRSDENSAIL